MEPGRRTVPLLSTIRTLAETGSTNADLLELARSGAAEGLWLTAARQTAGRGRQGRAWVSPPGNFHGSTLVRLRAADPPPATLGFVAAVALCELVAELLLRSLPSRTREGQPNLPSRTSGRGEAGISSINAKEGGLVLKWPNDLLLGGAKLSGILLERAEDAVVVGIGVNLAHHPDLPDRPTTSLAAHGIAAAPAAFAEMLADGFARWLARWRAEGIGPVRQRWLDLAHPRGTALAVHLPDGAQLAGLFDGLDPAGALILRLASGERRAIHAADVFLV